MLRFFALLAAALFSVEAARRPTDKKFPDAKPVAIVFPQFHRVPQNDKFWGEGFTEWTFLRPMGRVVNDILIRKPHPDIGYYNLLDYEHRRYMRVMADHFGVYGFNFYHFWFKDYPVMYKPTEKMLLDGEPNKPFFFTWANEPWSKRWDGNKDDILIAQDYDDIKGNKAHFEYLLKFFRHKNYMHINGKPIFCFYRVDKEDVQQIAAIMSLWQQMAVAEGLKGIFFIRFFGFFDNTVKIPGLDGFIEFEPGLSWQPQGGGPSIFPGGVFDEKIFLQNNKDLEQLSINATEYFNQASLIEQSYRTSQFKVYDKKRTWRVIEHRHFRNFPNTMRGTFVNWNNAPRRNFTNGNYIHYPHMIDPPSPSGFARHLQNLLPKVVEGVADDMKLLQLTAWNEWNEQSVFEPNDIDGYAALQEIKNVVRASTNKIVVHVATKGRVFERYIRDLSMLFDHYEHRSPATEVAQADQFVEHPPPMSNCALLHIHSVMLGANPMGWRVLDYAMSYRRASVPVYVTVHDYQFLFPENPNPSLEFLSATSPQSANVKKTMNLFSMCQKIIFPSSFIKEYYLRALKTLEGDSESLGSIEQAAETVPHNDALASDDLLRIPEVRRSVINVGFIGDFLYSNGGSLFLGVADKLPLFLTPDTFEKYTVQYHVFGPVAADPGCSGCTAESLAEKFPSVTFHGEFADDRVLNYYLRKNSIHLLMFTNLSPEVYGYPLTVAINKGLPIVYLNRGAFLDRLDYSQYDKYFPTSRPDGLVSNLQKALQYVIDNSGEKFERCCRRSFDVQPRKWYINNYPEIIP